MARVNCLFNSLDFTVLHSCRVVCTEHDRCPAFRLPDGDAGRGLVKAERVVRGLIDTHAQVGAALVDMDSGEATQHIFLGVSLD